MCFSIKALLFSFLFIFFLLFSLIKIGRKKYYIYKTFHCLLLLNKKKKKIQTIAQKFLISFNIQIIIKMGNYSER